jgi:hypothetical protein
VDCLRFKAAERGGCDLVINAPSSDILWLYVLLLKCDCEAIIAT